MNIVNNIDVDIFIELCNKLCISNVLTPVILHDFCRRGFLKEEKDLFNLPYHEIEKMESFIDIDTYKIKTAISKISHKAKKELFSNTEKTNSSDKFFERKNEDEFSKTTILYISENKFRKNERILVNNKSKRYTVKPVFSAC